jgi:type I restriction enzyme S subunit
VHLERIKEERKNKLGKKYRELAPIDTSELPELPKGWMWVRLGEISDDIQYGYTAKAINEPLGPKMLRITDIQENNVDWNNVPYCVIEPDKEKKYLLNEGDLVFARTGATVGKSFLIKGKIPKSIFASYLIRIVLSKNVFKEYVYNFFQSYEYLKQIILNQLGIGQPNVNSQILSKIILPLPPLPEQYQIVEEIERRFSVADEVEKVIDNSLKQAERLRQSILKKAFEGKLVPQDPNDEPAEKLLKRIMNYEF